MNRMHIAGIALVVVLSNASSAQTSSQKTLAGTLDVYAFPSAGQAADQQSKDEAECYQWAIGNTGSDPFEVSKQASQQQQQAQQQQQQASKAKQGSGAKGALGGAAAGALIGEISSGDAGEGAAYGAAAGMIIGRRRARQTEKQTTEQIQQQSAQYQTASATQVENFKKAFSVCLEAKEYLVRY